MVTDIGEVKRHIRPKADSTLRNMRKDDLIEYIRCLEHNYNVAVSFNENQAKYIESLDAVLVVRCKDCKNNGACSIQDAMNWTPRTEIGDYYCSYGERRTDETLQQLP